MGGRPFLLCMAENRTLPASLETVWETWGDNGGAWLLEADFNLLLASGEMAFPTKVRF